VVVEKRKKRGRRRGKWDSSSLGSSTLSSSCVQEEEEGLVGQTWHVFFFSVFGQNSELICNECTHKTGSSSCVLNFLSMNSTEV
jgi:hypothetical protein